MAQQAALPVVGASISLLAHSSDSLAALLRDVWERAPLRTCIGAAGTIFVGKLLWDQYSMVLRRNRPKVSASWPLVGATWDVFYKGYFDWAFSVLGGSRAVFAYVFGMPTVVVSWPVYMKYVRKADHGGELHQGVFPFGTQRLVGEHSILLLQAGKGHSKHHRLRHKILDSLAPRRVLALVPDMCEIIRAELDAMAAETAAKGRTSFASCAKKVPTMVSSLPIVGGISEEKRAKMFELMEVFIEGFIAANIDLGRFSALGRGLIARRELMPMLEELMASPDLSHKNIIGDLAKSSDGEQGFSKEEILDTALTLLFAGQVTTSVVLPHLVVELSRQKDWAKRIAEEPFEFAQIEPDTATTRFIRETLRLHPAEAFVFRCSRDAPVDLGEDGVVPRGYNIMINFGEHMRSLGDDFDPDRWTEDLVRDSFLSFGGSTPHSCVGRSLAMVEMQVFARLLCKEYDVEVLDTTPARDWQWGGLFFGFKDGLPLRVTKKAEA